MTSEKNRGGHHFGPKLHMKLLTWFAGHDVMPRVGRWDWNRNAFSVGVGGEEVYWVTDQDLQAAVTHSDWSELEKGVRRAVREWVSAKDWPWTHRDEETGYLFGIRYGAFEVEEGPKHPGEQLFSLMNLTTEEGPVEVWGRIGVRPNAFELQRLVDEGKV